MTVPVEPLTIYLASRYSRRAEMCENAERLRTAGHVVEARWLSGDHEVATYDPAEPSRRTEIETDDDVAAAARFAAEDVADVLNADLVATFTEPARSSASRGGRHVEYGINLGAALATNSRVSGRTVVVGPVENVFYALVDDAYRFADFDAFAAALETAGPCGAVGSLTQNRPPTSNGIVDLAGVAPPCVRHAWHVGAHSWMRDLPNPSRAARRRR